MKSAIFLQARMSSQRFPGKMLMNVGEISLVEWMLRRCSFFSNGELVALLTSEHESDAPLACTAASLGFPCFRGPLDNVRERYHMAARFYDVDIICRVCGDSPFVDLEAAATMISAVRSGQAAYARLTDVPNGFVSEVFSAKALEQSLTLDDSSAACEHVTPAMLNHPDIFPQLLLRQAKYFPELSIPLTVDTREDFECIQRLSRAGLNYRTPSAECFSFFTEVDPKIWTGMIATNSSEEINHVQEKKSCPCVQGKGGAFRSFW